jgi:hypothetical protein
MLDCIVYIETIGLWLADCYFLLLSQYQISDWRNQETIGLSGIGSSPQYIGLSNIRLRINYQLSTSVISPWQGLLIDITLDPPYFVAGQYL